MKHILSLCASLALIASSLATVPSIPQAYRYAKEQLGTPEKRYAELNRRQAKPNNTIYSYEQLLSFQTRFLDAFMYPANQKQAQAINSSLFAENVQGRVDITRTFNGRELNTEYIFGLFANLANSTGFTLLGVPKKYEILQFAASGNIASASTRIMFFFPALQKEVPLIIDTWNAFNDRGEIEMYDAVFRHWSWAFDSFIDALSAAFHTTKFDTAKNITASLAKSICTTHTQYCQGENIEYASNEACLGYLNDPNKVRLGESYELGRNTLLCRMVHQGMVALRPETHCPHIGPQGGGMCVDDHDYAKTVMENYFTNAPWVVPLEGIASTYVLRGSQGQGAS